MNASPEGNSVTPQEDSIDPNLTYDLAEGHNRSLKGSMNNKSELPKAFDDVLLALH